MFQETKRFAVILAIILAAYNSVYAANGEFAVAVEQNGKFVPAGTLGYDKDFVEKSLDLPVPSGQAQVRVQISFDKNRGAHIDSAILGGKEPSAVSGTGEDQLLALKKLAKSDYDVISIEKRTITLVYDSPQSPTLNVNARVEPEVLSPSPFMFPEANIYKPVTLSSQFYTYKLNDNYGHLNVNGDLNDEQLGEPFFKVWSQTGSGHPSNYTYGWVKNDDRHLYAAIDFAPDNTMDGDKDYTEVYVKTGHGVKRFKASVPEQKYGKPGFVYTDKAVYQHKVYEFQIPLDEVGVEAGDALELVFSAYGTASPPPPASGLTAIGVSATQINLSWTDNSTWETGFRIFRNGTLIATTLANATAYSDTGLICSTTYNYEVKSSYDYSGFWADSVPTSASGTT